MKKLITIVSLLFIAKTTIAQYQLFGKWEVFCPIETQSPGTLRHCDICTTEKNEKLGDVVYGFEMEFKKDSLHIINLGATSQKVKYYWDEKSRIVSFNYRSKDYSFSLLSCGSWDNLVLKDRDCLILTLSRKAERK